MKKVFSIFTLITLIVACQHTNKNRKKEQTDNADQATNTNDVSAKRSNRDLSFGSLSWSDSLLKMYMTFADNKSIKQARKANYFEDWIYDNTLNTDSAVYDVYRIGHDEPKQDYSDTLFMVDQWVYIDTKRKQLFEYEATGKKLTRWWVAEDMESFFYPVYELSPKTTALVVTREPESDGILDKLFNKLYPPESLYTSSEGPIYNRHVAKNWKVYDTTGLYRLMESDKFKKAAHKYFNQDFYVYGTRGMVKTRVTNVVFGLDECMTNIFAFCFDNSSIKSIGHPVFCSSKLIDLTYSSDYSNIEKNIQNYLSQLPADYTDSIKTKVIGNVGDFYFTYNDDFLWGQKNEQSKCKFPARSIYYVEKKKEVMDFEEHSLDLFGIECD